MFKVTIGTNNEIRLAGRFDASQVAAAKEALDRITSSSVIDFGELEYISSAGMGTLLATQKRLVGLGHKLTLINLNKHIKDIFGYAGFDKVFEIR